MSIELEPTYRLYSKTGYFWEITVDPDHGHGVEIRYYDGRDDMSPDRVYLEEDAIEPMIKALQLMKTYIKENVK